MDSHLEENGRYLHKSAETRDLVTELQQDRHNCKFHPQSASSFRLMSTIAQQVIDMLREKLSTIGFQLIESKQKVADLELRQSNDSARWARRTDNFDELGM